MLGAFVTALLAVAGPAPSAICPEAAVATSAAYRLAELPPEIREDLARISNNEMADRGAPLLQTDAPGPAERDLARGRFVQGLLIDGTWFVSFAPAMMTPRTIGYVRSPDGRFRRWSDYYFGGPPCAAIAAARSGVTTPGGFNF